MKKGIRKSFELAWKMLKWAEDNKDKVRDPYVRVEVDMVRFDCKPYSYKDVHRFMKQFPQTKKLDRSTFNNESLSYTGWIGTLYIDMWMVKELPPSCKLTYEEVEVPEEYIPGHVEPAHTKKVAKMVCGNGKAEEVAA